MNESDISFGELKVRAPTESGFPEINPLPPDYESRGSVVRAMGECMTGIFIAGTCFGLAIVSVFGIIGAIAFQQVSPLVFGGACAAMIIGLIVSAITGQIAYGFIKLFNWIFDGVLTRRTAVVLTGSLAAYLPFSWTIVVAVEEIFFPWQGSSDGVDIFVFLATPFAAMIFGYIGAIWAAWNAMVWTDLKQQLDFEENTPRKKFQFRIEHLMKIMLVFSAIFAANQISSNHEILISVGFYIVLQSLLLIFDYHHFGRYKRRILNE